MPLTIGGLAVGAIGTGINLYNSDKDREAAQDQLNDLRNTPIEQYSADPRLNDYYSRATNDVNNPQGFTGAQKSGFNANLNNQTNTIFRNATGTSGGNLSKYISAAIGNQKLGSINEFAGRDASLALENKNRAYGRQFGAINQFQDISNRNVAAKNYRQQLIAQALGGSIAQQNQNIAGAISNLAGAGFGVAGMGLSGAYKKPPAPEARNPYLGTSSTSFQQGVGYNYSTPDYSTNFFG